MNSILITGGSGFFGRILSRWLAERGFQCTNIDLLVHNEQDTPNIRHVQIDVTDAVQVNRVFKNHHFDAVIHCAAMLPLSDTSKTSLWKTNVQGTCNIAQAAADHAVKKLVFTSTSCLWGQPMGRPVTEADTPHPVDIYGESKWEAEKCLEQFRGRFDYVILRIPLIVDAGRMGLLAILFEFIEEGRSVWVVGRGRNRYHFVLASTIKAVAFLMLARMMSSPCERYISLLFNRPTLVHRFVHYHAVLPLSRCVCVTCWGYPRWEPTIAALLLMISSLTPHISKTRLDGPQPQPTNKCYSGLMSITLPIAM